MAEQRQETKITPIRQANPVIAKAMPQEQKRKRKP
jgi:hypothetical protein